MSKHVDDFIDFGSVTGENKNDGELYARYMLHHFRLPAILQMAFRPFIEGKRLFCTCGGERWRVTGASTLGDVWLAADILQTDGYDVRVNVEDCTAVGGGTVKPDGQCCELMSLALGRCYDRKGLELAPFFSFKTGGHSGDAVILHFKKGKKGDPHPDATYAQLSYCPFCGVNIVKKRKGSK